MSAAANKAAKSNHVVDIFAGHTDQVGFYELKYFPLLTSGNLLMGDSFLSRAFRQSIMKFFTKIYNQDFLFNGVMEVKCSTGLKVMGCVGTCSSMNTTLKNVSKINVGIGSTARWKLNSITEESTFTFFFEAPSTAEEVRSILHNQSKGFIQFVTNIVCANGTKRLRVTTACRRWRDVSNGLQNICEGFDETAAVVAASKYAIYVSEFEDNPDCVKSLDRMLIALVRTFADYIPNSPSTLKLPPNFHMFPQFMFHFRRSNLMTTFNISPDESTYFKHIFLKSPLGDNLTMIQPVLLSCSFKDGFHPAILDASSIRPDNVLILDTYYMVLIYLGQVIYII